MDSDREDMRDTLKKNRMGEFKTENVNETAWYVCEWIYMFALLLPPASWTDKQQSFR